MPDNPNQIPPPPSGPPSGGPPFGPPPDGPPPGDWPPGPPPDGPPSEMFGQQGDFGAAEELPPGFMAAEGMPGGDGPPQAAMPQKMSALPYVGRAMKLLGKYKLQLALSLVLMLVVSLAPFLVSASFGPLIQILGEAAAQNNWNAVWSIQGSLYNKPEQLREYVFEDYMATPLSFTTIFIVWALASILAVLLQLVQQWRMTLLEQSLDVEVQQQVYDHMQTLSLDFFTGAQTGGLMPRVLIETQSVQKLLTQVLLSPLVDIISLVIALAYLLGLSWQMTIVALILGPFAFFLFRLTMKKLESSANEMMMNNRDLNAELEESISGMADIQVFNAQQKRSHRFNQAARAVANSTSRMLIWMHVSNTSSQVYVAVSTAMVLLVGIMFGSRFGLTLASLIVFIGFVPAMFAPVQRVIMSYTTYQSLVPGIVGTYQLLDTRPTVLERPGAQPLPPAHGNVRFENVVFGYTPQQKILDGISFDIREGETVSLVGPIGCGKSTIMNLLLRFLEPEAGRITIDGHDITGVTLQSLRSQVSKLSQFPFFLKDTIRENVRLGKADAQEGEITWACRTAHIHDVITDSNRMPQGYNTIVDVQVPSGGQKRLIALARCLLRNPEVLLLDEPTENLDADQRNRLIKVIREYAKNPQNRRTCVVISHDLNFVAAVSDRILVLNHGKVEEEGTHEELVVREGLYKTLYELKNIDPALLRKRDDPASDMAASGMAMGMPGGMGMGM
ncbi:MAG TPA: ABC transporter ATP-binding protein [Pyrinomonadaceae bacterium]|nr:ABC transporter ATP-binding protein [Pyrinomonadaceae bacterium]